MDVFRRCVLSCVFISLFALPAIAHKEGHDSDPDNGKTVRCVLLISIDGMHVVVFINCSQGVNSLKPYCPHLTELAENGINHLDTSTSKPSDSFPGLTAIVSGGSPRAFGVYYDVAYDRALAPTKNMTGNGLSGGTCTTGTNTIFGVIHAAGGYTAWSDKHPATAVIRV